MPERLRRAAQIAVGTKQTLKAVQAGTAGLVYLADDAEPKVVAPLAELASLKEVPIVRVATMAELGGWCGIEVGAAAAALIRRADDE